ncbi:putative quinol monooxygenase [Pedobacter jamesrossensis]|uniref:Quinol monooxygenase n=1 Tax=Pedobacter jamesrossensis TaxID=1908238 RepID=A0ABV8NLR0_9SPHI
MKHIFNTGNLKEIFFISFLIAMLQFKVEAQEQKPDSKQLVLNIKFKASPENSEKFRKVLLDLFDTISNEPNFVEAKVYQELGKPGEFLVNETWNDNIEHFLTVQMKKPYALEYEKKLKELNVDRSPAAYKVLGSYKKKR